MNSLKTTGTQDEMLEIATAVMKNQVKANLDEIRKFWMNLKKTNQVYRELRNMEESTGISPQTMENFGAIILEPYAPEIFGRPKRQMTNSEIGDISLVLLLRNVKHEGFHILSKDKERRRLGNIASVIGIKPERLTVFANFFMKIAIDMVYPLPDRST